ncbi:hypothetical protein Tco_0483410 [Tanacetum coccineum]
MIRTLAYASEAYASTTRPQWKLWKVCLPLANRNSGLLRADNEGDNLKWRGLVLRFHLDDWNFSFNYITRNLPPNFVKIGKSLNVVGTLVNGDSLLNGKASEISRCLVGDNKCTGKIPARNYVSSKAFSHGTQRRRKCSIMLSTRNARVFTVRYNVMLLIFICRNFQKKNQEQLEKYVYFDVPIYADDHFKDVSGTLIDSASASNFYDPDQPLLGNDSLISTGLRSISQPNIEQTDLCWILSHSMILIMKV